QFCAFLFLSIYVSYRYFFKDRPNLIIFQALLINSVLFKSNVLNNWQEEFPMWALNRCGPKLQKRIEREVKFWIIFIMVVLVVAFLMWTTILRDREEESEYCFMIWFLRKYYPCF